MLFVLCLIISSITACLEKIVLSVWESVIERISTLGDPLEKLTEVVALKRNLTGSV